jgi:hypothetical protein
MGDAADMILDGILDEQTGEYIGPAVGYPRTMNHEISAETATNGVVNYMRKRGVKDKARQMKLLEDFLLHIGIRPYKMKKTKMCQIISEDFASFKKFTNPLKH